MMSTQNTIQKKKLDRMKVIYGNDCAVLDFLCDLNTREVIIGLQHFIDDSKGNPGCFLSNCVWDSMVVMILYKDPFGFSEGDNNLTMYADNDLQGLIKYFKNQLDNTSPDAGNIYKALNDINRLLYREWVKQEDKNTLCNFMG